MEQLIAYFRKASSSLAFRLGVAIFSVVAVIAAITGGGVLQRLSLVSGLFELAEEALDSSYDRTLKIFLSVSTIKGTLAVLEGSEVGLSVGPSIALEAGDIIQPVYDYIDLFWHAVLYAMLLIAAYRVLFACGILGVGVYFILAGVFLVMVVRGVPALRRLGVALVLIGAVTAYGVPSLVLISSSLSSTFLSPYAEQTSAELARVGAEFTKAVKLVTEPGPEGGAISILRPLDGLATMRRRLDSATSQIMTLSWSSMRLLLTFLAVTLIELLLLPLTIGVVLSQVIRKVLPF